MASAYAFITDYDDLIQEVLNFTGSTDRTEIQSCITLAELKMRVLELPGLRSDPFDPAFQAQVDTDGEIPIPGDMLKPILFFFQGTGGDTASGDAGLGPWIVYDRVGDREILRRYLIDQLYLKPFNIPAVYRGQFSEVGGKYVFVPKISTGAVVNLYYYRAWPFLGTTTTDNPPQVVNNNIVLQTFPEGYFYATLWQYYNKKKNTEEAQKWKAEFDAAYGLIEDQNFKGKWAGGERKLFSNFQPRRQRFSYK